MRRCGDASGGICILTRDVPRLAAWYRALLGVEGGSDDPVHQYIWQEEPSLTILRDESERTGTVSICGSSRSGCECGSEEG